MRKIAILMAFCLASVGVLAGCGKAETTGAGTSRDAQSVQAATAQPEENTTAADGRSAQSGTAADEQASNGATFGTTTASGQTTAPTDDPQSAGTTAAQTGSGVPTQAGKPSASAAQTTAKADKPATTKQSDGKASATVGGSTVTPSGETTTSAGKPSLADTTQIASDNAISGKLSYLNNAAVTYLPALNADDLKGFGITGDKQNEILKHKSDWAAYTIQIDFQNNTQTPLTIYYLDVTDNGKGEVYVCGDTAGELGMAAGGKMSEKFFVLAKKDDSDIEVRQKLVSMAMRVQYAQTPEDDTVTPKFKYSRIG